MTASEPKAFAHVLAVIAQSRLEIFKDTSISNIRTSIAPAQIKEFAYEKGWTAVFQSFLTPEEGIMDGRLEAGIVISKRFWDEVEARCRHLATKIPQGLIDFDAILHDVRQLWEATNGQVQLAGKIKDVRSMDIYWVIFKKRSEQGGELDDPDLPERLEAFEKVEEDKRNRSSGSSSDTSTDTPRRKRKKNKKQDRAYIGAVRSQRSSTRSSSSIAMRSSSATFIPSKPITNGHISEDPESSDLSELSETDQSSAEVEQELNPIPNCKSRIVIEID